MTTATKDFHQIDDIYDIIVGTTNLDEALQQKAILDLLHYVGFKVTHFTHEALRRHHTDEDRHPTNETFELNSNSKIKVFDGEEENSEATRWFDKIWRSVGQPAKYTGELGQKLIALSKAIEESIRLQPIVLTQYGEKLCESYNPQENHTHDEDKLSTIIGAHSVCNGYLDIKKISSGYNAILCRNCHLRVVIPETITTYKELREFFKELQ